MQRVSRAGRGRDGGRDADDLHAGRRMQAGDSVVMEGDAETRPAVSGRPRHMLEVERRAHLIAAAADLFLHRGYHATTMDDIARCAGMSKKTVYQVFSSKSDLFDGLLSDWFAPFAAPIEADDRPPRQVLTDALVRLANFALSERQVLLMRLLIAETSCSEEIATALDRQCIGRGKGALEQWLAAQAAGGGLTIDNPREAANMLFFATVGDFLMRLLLWKRQRPTAEEVRGRVEYTVAAFFRQFG
ncbi:MAG: TetR/AcrR family transcriptional regulator [Bradyrhizobiaceae bacterium]|nr:TetR/AcrR family transcriptional regulator [Bradyrhizobiaceae bacterium]